ncbi:MAG: helix-turn-helix domain-containing protein [Chloroflexi bacterium]|nr:helix-turn-helix domain-containing protein [Chloroflexota bacterium]
MEGSRIKELRLRLGLSQERFARLLGVSLQSVHRWESGQGKPLPIIRLKLEELQRAGLQGGIGVTIEEKRRRAVPEVGVGVGLGSLFKGIGNLIDLVTTMVEEGRTEETHTGTLEGAEGRVKGVYGFTVKLGLGGEPVVQRFGNIRETEAGPVVTEVREPLVDVLDEGDHVVVIVELPGVDAKDIRLGVKGGVLQIDAATGDRKYNRETALPSPVDPASLVSSYRNGVLEVKLTKQGRRAS